VIIGVFGIEYFMTTILLQLFFHHIDIVLDIVDVEFMTCFDIKFRVCFGVLYEIVEFKLLTFPFLLLLLL